MSGTNPMFLAKSASLAMDAAMLDTIVGHLADALPNEGVGLVAVLAEGRLRRAVAFFPGTNVDLSPTRYTMDPAEVAAALRVMDANGWQLGAIAHSHVSTAPTPSATDLREAYYPDALMLIVGYGSGVAEARLWQHHGGQTVAEACEARLLIDHN